MKLPITKDQLSRLLPHAGDMCLLDEILQWSDRDITAKTTTHVDEKNPLRFGQTLPITAAIEYASQAIAIHGTLLNAKTANPKIGLIGSLRNVYYHTDRLDDKAGSLIIHANLIQALAQSQQYHFKIEHNNISLISGDILVILQ